MRCAALVIVAVVIALAATAIAAADGTSPSEEEQLTRRLSELQDERAALRAELDERGQNQGESALGRLLEPLLGRPLRRLLLGLTLLNFALFLTRPRPRVVRRARPPARRATAAVAAGLAAGLMPAAGNSQDESETPGYRHDLDRVVELLSAGDAERAIVKLQRRAADPILLPVIAVPGDVPKPLRSVALDSPSYFYTLAVLHGSLGDRVRALDNLGRMARARGRRNRDRSAPDPTLLLYPAAARWALVSLTAPQLAATLGVRAVVVGLPTDRAMALVRTFHDRAEADAAGPIVLQLISRTGASLEATSLARVLFDLDRESDALAAHGRAVELAGSWREFAAAVDLAIERDRLDLATRTAVKALSVGDLPAEVPSRSILYPSSTLPTGEDGISVYSFVGSLYERKNALEPARGFYQHPVGQSLARILDAGAFELPGNANDYYFLQRLAEAEANPAARDLRAVLEAMTAEALAHREAKRLAALRANVQALEAEVAALKRELDRPFGLSWLPSARLLLLLFFTALANATPWLVRARVPARFAGGPASAAVS